MRRFGSRVTIVQRGPRLLDREDPDVAAAIFELMQDEGIDVLLQAQVLDGHRPLGHWCGTASANGNGGEKS